MFVKSKLLGLMPEESAAIREKQTLQQEVPVETGKAAGNIAIHEVILAEKRRAIQEKLIRNNADASGGF
jgi:hypothetical protein